MIIKGHIYCVTCLPTGKLYFGQTVMSIEERWNRHVNESKFWETFEQGASKKNF